jgi:hypothetical protein
MHYSTKFILANSLSLKVETRVRVTSTRKSFFFETQFEVAHPAIMLFILVPHWSPASYKKRSNNIYKSVSSSIHLYNFLNIFIKNTF